MEDSNLFPEPTIIVRTEKDRSPLFKLSHYYPTLVMPAHH